MEHASPPVSGPPPARRRFMLTVWALIPTALLLALIVVSGNEASYLVNGLPGYAFGFATRLVLQYFPASLLLTWILFRLTRRSRFWATVFFTCCLFLCGLYGTWQLVLVHSINQRTQRAIGVPAIATFQNFQFELAPGWQSVQSKSHPGNFELRPVPDEPNRNNCIINIASNGVKIEAVRPVPEFLYFPDGRFPATAVVLDGADGIRVDRPRDCWPNPRYTVFVSKNGKMYGIAASDKNGADVTAAFDRILRTWRWVNKP